MEWISLKVCPGSHFDGQGDVSHLPTRLAPDPNLSPSSLPLESPQHTNWVQADCDVCPAASIKPLNSHQKSLPAVSGGSKCFHSQLSPAFFFCSPKGQDLSGSFGMCRIVLYLTICYSPFFSPLKIISSS